MQKCDWSGQSLCAIYTLRFLLHAPNIIEIEMSSGDNLRKKDETAPCRVILEKKFTPFLISVELLFILAPLIYLQKC